MPRYERTRVVTPVGTRSRTKKAAKAETDINLMVGRYMKTGAFANINPREPIYGDFSEAVTLEEAFNITRQAEASFMTLPAAVRAAADNNPVTLLAMLADPAQTEVLVKAGLPVKPKEAQTPAPAPNPESAPTTPEGENPTT